MVSINIFHRGGKGKDKGSEKTDSAGGIDFTNELSKLLDASLKSNGVGGSLITPNDEIMKMLYMDIKSWEEQIRRPVGSMLGDFKVDFYRVPMIPYGLKFYQDIWVYSTIVNIIVRSLVDETFRNGFYVKPKWKWKCKHCGTEYYDDKPNKCEVCGRSRFLEPDKAERFELEKLLREPVNMNNEYLIDVLKQVDVDINILDNAWIVILKDYVYRNGKILREKPKEVLRADPTAMYLIMSADGRPGLDDEDNVILTCPEHRTEYQRWPLVNYEEGDIPKCPVCGKPMVPAVAVFMKLMGAKNSRKYFYIDGEVLHIKKFTPGYGYGLPPIMTVLVKVLILMKMDYFIYMAYSLQRPPRGLLVIKGNQQNIKRSWDFTMQKAYENPHMIYPLILEADEGLAKANLVEWIDLSYSDNTVNFTEFRNQLRRMIGARWGVEPLYHADLSTGGGLSVLPDTPVVIRRDGKWIDIVPIASLHTDYMHNVSKYGLKNIEVLSRNGWTKILSTIRHRKTKKGYRIVMGDAFVEVSEDHSIFLSDGSVVRGGDLAEGQEVMIYDGDVSSGKAKGVFSKDFAYALGLFLAEGSAVKSPVNHGGFMYRVVIYNDDVEMLKRAKKGMDAFFGVNGVIRHYKDGPARTNRLEYNNMDVYNWFMRYCYSTWKYAVYGSSKTIRVDENLEKKVPIQILNSDDKIVRTFLDGYMDGDGYVSTIRTEESFRGIYKTLMAGIKYLTNRLGRTTSMFYVPPPTKNHNEQVKIRILKGHRKVSDGYIKKLVEFEEHTDWYDITTEDGSFVGGIGLVVLHNSNQGLQITVTNRAIENEQSLFNRKILPWICEQLHFKDWVIQLKPHEEKDLTAILDREMKRVQLAQGMLQLGYKPTLKEGVDGIEFVYSSVEEKELINELKAYAKRKEIPEQMIQQIIQMLQNPQQGGMMGAGGEGAMVGTVGDLKGGGSDDNGRMERPEGAPEGWVTRAENQDYHGQPKSARKERKDKGEERHPEEPEGKDNRAKIYEYLKEEGVL